MTSAKLTDGAITAPKLANQAVQSTAIANGAVLEQHLASGLVGGVNKVVRGVVSFSGTTYENTQSFSTAIDPAKSYVILSLAASNGHQVGQSERVLYGATLVTGLASNSITIAVSVSDTTNFLKLEPHRVSFQIIELK